MVRKWLRARHIRRNVAGMNRTPRKAKIVSASSLPTAAPGMKAYGAEREVFPYWKVQWYDVRSMTWRDEQVKHHRREGAEDVGRALKARVASGRARLMEVQAKGRAPLPEL